MEREWVIRIPGSPVRWAVILADSREAALQKAKDAGYTNADIQGHTDPSDTSSGGYIGDSSMRFFQSNPDRMVDLTVSSNNAAEERGEFVGSRFDEDAIAALMDEDANLGSVFRNFLSSKGIGPTTGLGRQATARLANPLLNLLQVAEGGGLNIGQPGGGGAYSPQSASEFLRTQGLSGITQGASNILGQLAGPSIGGTEQFRRPETAGNEQSLAAQRILLAAMAKTAPHFALSDFGSQAVSQAAQQFFDARQGGQLGKQGIDPAQVEDENLFRFVRERLGSQLFA